MRRMKPAGWAALALGALPGALGAQDRADSLAGRDAMAVVAAGARVRVTLANRAAPAPLVGTVLYVDRDSLVVEREEGGVRTLAPRHVETVEVSVRKELEPAKAAGYGILTAAPILVPFLILLPVLAAVAEEGGGSVLVYGAGIIGGAALAGVLIGGTSAQDVWIEAVWPDRPEGR